MWRVVRLIETWPGGEAGANGPPAATHDANANKPAMQTTAITTRPLIMVNVSSSILNIRHLIFFSGCEIGDGLDSVFGELLAHAPTHPQLRRSQDPV